MNESILDLVNGGLAGRFGLLDGLAEFMARDGLYVLAACAALLGVLQLRREFATGMRAGIAVVVGACLLGAAVLVLGTVVQESRPFVHDGDTVQLIAHGSDNGFPSDHAAMAALVAVVGSLYWPRWSWLLCAGALLIGVSRVVVGVHYPGDVLAGWLVGTVAAVVAWRLAEGFLPRVRLLRARPVPIA